MPTNRERNTERFRILPILKSLKSLRDKDWLEYLIKYRKIKSARMKRIKSNKPLKEIFFLFLVIISMKFIINNTILIHIKNTQFVILKKFYGKIFGE